jgi:hypothetical protein
VGLNPPLPLETRKAPSKFCDEGEEEEKREKEKEEGEE